MDRQSAIRHTLRRGSRTAAELAAAAGGVSQPMVSHLVRQMPDVLRIGAARRSRYVLLRPLAPSTPAEPVVRGLVTVRGALDWQAPVLPAYPAGYLSGVEEYPHDLPWFLNDLRPSGYLGRCAARQLSARGYPADIRLWNGDHTLRALASGDLRDTIGNQLLGVSATAFERDPEASDRVVQFPVSEAHRLSVYEHTAQQQDSGALPGSSAAGEQPKFLGAVPAGPEHGEFRHVLVKFTAPRAEQSGQRWSDLLVMEELALATIASDLGLSTATARVCLGPTRTFLEVTRFDRIGRLGRRGVFSFTTLDAQFVGVGDHWLSVAEGLVAERLLCARARDQVALLAAFGAQIGNTDMHLGNLSILDAPGADAELTPAYDVLPMMYAPTPSGTYDGLLPAHDLARFALRCEDDPVWRITREAARAFWTRAARDERISAPMRARCQANSTLLV